MKFSIMFSFVAPAGAPLSHLQTFQEMDRLVPLIEACGYDGFHVTEHHFQSEGWLPSPLMALAKASALSKRLELATNILVSTLYAPVQLLEDLAVLDNLCEGRLILGTSPGYVLEEFAGRGLDATQRFKLHEEMIDFIQHAWANPENIGFNGKLVQVPPLKLRPVPVQKRLPIWYGVSGPKLLERAARRGVPVTASPRHTVAELKDHFARYEAVAAEAGYVPTERPVIRDGLVLDTTAEAERFGGPGVMGLFGLYGKKSASGERALRDDTGELITDEGQLDFRTFASRYIIGDPAVAKDRIQELIDELAPTELVFRMQMPGVPTDVLERSIRLFAEKVMPAFR
jgi:alkanesulfonate monooxygenase SsuD/methylene tetrahydromethanopterin reductase-like flavin-dependent oxidoreductase (luciferase family)